MLAVICSYEKALQSTFLCTALLGVLLCILVLPVRVPDIRKETDAKQTVRNPELTYDDQEDG